jgi:thiol-disulfide isomerase/thioredoxin
MKKLLLALILSSAAGFAQTSTPADADYASFEALAKAHPPGSPQEIGAAKYLTWLDDHGQAVKSAALAFQAAYPADARRWELVMAAVKAPPFFIKSFGPDVESKGPGAIIADEAAVAGWRQQGEALTQAMLASGDASPTLREDAEWGLSAKDFRATSAAKAKGQPYDYSGFRAQFDAHVAKYAGMDVVADRAADYLGALERNLPGASKEIWQHLLDAPNAALRTKAAERMKLFEILARPIDLVFVAVDGRSIDLAKLRGRIVLVDFWATWCGPCKEEIPNVKKVYAAYHDKGFEVVGIALEHANLNPKDSPEQTTAKVAKAKKILTDFTTKEEMPWPQYFDGKFWKNDISTQYGINSIPAMFLLDQEGKVVTTNARGAKLEEEVKRLLKLGKR